MIPSPNVGTLLDNISFQVCIGLRLSCNLCTAHICKCNAKVDEIDIHSLSCSKSRCRFSRHNEINSIINQSLTSIHVNSTLEPNYIFKGLAFETLGPWCKEAIDFINVIGERLIAESGDSKSKKFLFERISLAIQRGNAASIRTPFQIPHYYRKFLYCKPKMLCT
jgi:hypothetical protein